MITLIVESNPAGHHFAYVKHVASHAITHGDRVILLTLPDCIGNPSYAEFIEPLLNESFTIVLDEKLASVGTRAQLVAEVATATGADNIVILAADSWLKSWRREASGRLRGGTVTRLLVMRSPATVWSDRGLMWRLLGGMAKAWLMRGLARSGNTRVLLLSHAGRMGLPLSLRFSRVKAVSDYVECRYTARDRDFLRQRLGLDPERFYVSIVGEISERKNPLALTRAASDLPDDVSVILAGAHSPGVASGLSTLPAGIANRVTSIGGWLSEDDVDAYVAASDMVAILHEDKMPSGILGKAIVAGIPCLLWGNQLSISQANRAGLAVTAAGIEPVQLAEAIEVFRQRPGAKGVDLSAIENDSARFARDVLRL